MAERSTLVRSGLFTTQGSPVPLSGVTIATDISNFCARVSVIQRYVNRESTPIEAVYVFPLEEGAAVCGFEAIIDGTLVIGEVKERDEAFRMYDDAIERGDGAFLLDEERPDVFQASVGNLPPGKEALLKLTYVSELAVEDGAVTDTGWEGDSMREIVPDIASRIDRFRPYGTRHATGGFNASESVRPTPTRSWTGA